MVSNSKVAKSNAYLLQIDQVLVALIEEYALLSHLKEQKASKWQFQGKISLALLQDLEITTTFSEGAAGKVTCLTPPHLCF